MHDRFHLEKGVGGLAEQQVTDQRQHAWHAIRLVPVEVMEGLDGEPAIFHTKEVKERVACTVCCQGLDSDTIHSECPGSDEGAED